MTVFEDLLEALHAHRIELGGFHEDRELSDRVLLATGWRCLADLGHPRRVKWEFGVNPICTSWEPHHPHPVQRMEDAFGQFPFGWRVRLMAQANRHGAWKVEAVSRQDVEVWAEHPSLPIALSIVAVTVWELSAMDARS